MSPDALTPVAPDAGHARYAALAAELRRRVVQGDWRPGSALPAETRLAAELGVARETMRRALELLVHEGMIERRHGKGTFVRMGLAGAPMLRFFRYGEATGELPSSKVISRRLESPTAEVARRLSVKPDAHVLKLQRVRSLGGLPRLFEEIWLPAARFSELTQLPLGQWGTLLYPFYAEHCGVAIARATDEIGFGALGAVPARALDLPVGHPGAVVTRQAFDLAGECVEYRITRGDAHAFHYAVTIT